MVWFHQVLIKWEVTVRCFQLEWMVGVRAEKQLSCNINRGQDSLSLDWPPEAERKGRH